MQGVSESHARADFAPPRGRSRSGRYSSARQLGGWIRAASPIADEQAADASPRQFSQQRFDLGESPSRSDSSPVSTVAAAAPCAPVDSTVRSIRDDLWAGRFVHDQHRSRFEHGRQRLANDVTNNSVSVARTSKLPDATMPSTLIAAIRTDHFPMSVRHVAHDTFRRRRAAVGALHRRCRAKFVEKNTSWFTRTWANLFEPRRTRLPYIWTTLLGGLRRLFFRGRFIRFSVRLTVPG